MTNLLFCLHISISIQMVLGPVGDESIVLFTHLNFVSDVTGAYRR